jgi:hypothetical protein
VPCLLLLPAGDFSKASTAQYTRRWMKAFGHDFPMSTKFAELIYRWVGLTFCWLWQDSR